MYLDNMQKMRLEGMVHTQKNDREQMLQVATTRPCLRMKKYEIYTLVMVIINKTILTLECVII